MRVQQVIHQPVAEKLRWIRENIAVPESYWTLVVFGLHSLNEYDGLNWEVFNNWEDLYTKLILRVPFGPTSATSYHYDFGLFLNLRDNNTPGLGIALKECGYERCIIRAMLLVTNGNVLFGDWGIPEQLVSNPTVEQLYQRYDFPSYIPEVTRHRDFPGKHGYRSFLAVLDHFLRPIDAQATEFSEEWTNRIRCAVEEREFTPQQLRQARWKAQTQLVFVKDWYDLLYHRWKWFPHLQLGLIYHYIRIRGWLGYTSSFFVLVHFLVYLFAVFVFVCLNGLLQYGVASYFPSVVLQWQPPVATLFSGAEMLRRTAKYLVEYFVYHTVFYTHKMLPPDHIPVRKLLKKFCKYAIIGSFLDILVWLFIGRMFLYIEEVGPIAWFSMYGAIVAVDLWTGYWYAFPDDYWTHLKAHDDRWYAMPQELWTRNKVDFLLQSMLLACFYFTVGSDKLSTFITNWTEIALGWHMLFQHLRYRTMRRDDFHYGYDFELFRSIELIPGIIGIIGQVFIQSDRLVRWIFQ